ncbi:hypothetical protein MRB53_039284 [Persea americana]|nr:hypothetical protein MRB53_039284 [Persea americana]
MADGEPSTTNGGEHTTASLKTSGLVLIDLAVKHNHNHVNGECDHGHNASVPGTGAEGGQWRSALKAGMVSPQDQAQDLRQSIIDVPHTFQYSCFHLECEGKRIPDFVDLSEVPGIKADAELVLVEDPYTDKDARAHVLRVRELIGAVGNHTDLAQGIQAGLTLHDTVQRSHHATTTNGNGHAANGQTADQHALKDYDIGGPGSLTALLPPSQAAAPKTIKSLSLSSWNPPPYHLRSRGHLLYLQVTTNEGEQHQITSHVTGFYLNKSSNSKFDPSPRTSPKSVSAHSLLSLLLRISPSFDSSFKALQDYNGQSEALALYQLTNAIQQVRGLSLHRPTKSDCHVSDLCRTQESYLLVGAANAETLRDWNEEIQTTRELPRETVQDRVFRERVISKLFADFNEAAVQGAVLVARGEVQPLNAMETEDGHIFVYNNVFYSYGADGVGSFTNEGGHEAARVAVSKDVIGSIVPGIFKQKEAGEQSIDYGGVEGKDVVADNPAFVPLFQRLSRAMRLKKHPVWDKEGKRWDLEASVESKGLLGTDGRKYLLDLYRLTPLDVSWIEEHWKGAAGAEEGQNGGEGYPHRLTTLRAELVDAFWRSKLRDYIRLQIAAKETAAKDATAETSSDAAAKDATVEQASDATTVTTNGDSQPTDGGAEVSKKEVEQDQIDISDFSFALNPDVFSGQRPQSEAEQDEYAKDEADVRAACDYLRDEVLPRLVGYQELTSNGLMLTAIPD